jgi:TetR/AcrR family transcriptional repressor of mexJK operon
MVEKDLVVEVKQARILDAAQKRFAHFGLEKTTMNEIAEDLGMSKASLYYYFTDKESIFKEVVIKEQRDFCQQMQELILSNNGIEQVLRNYIEKRIEYLKTLLNLGKLRYEAFRVNKPLFSELGKIFHEQERKLIKDILNKALERKEIIKLNVGEYAEFFISTLTAIRLYGLERKELWEEGSIDKTIKIQHLFFTNVFLKSIKA